MLKDFLRKHWNDFTGTPLPSVLQVVPISSCLEDYGNDIVLIFIDKKPEPEHIMKVSRRPEYGFKIKNEFRALKSLSGIQTLAPYIPKPHFIGDYNRNTFFIQSAVAGTSISNFISRKGLNKTNNILINKSIEILIAVNSAQVDKDINLAASRTTGESLFKRFEKIYIDAGISKKRLEELEDQQNQFACSGRTFFQHGDYWQANIIADKYADQIQGIIDWEFSSLNSEAPIDIIVFLINLVHGLYSRIRPYATRLDSYRWGFFESNKYTELLSSYYENYMSGMGLDYKWFTFLLERTLAEMSVREFAAYGRHSKMDLKWKDLFLYTIENKERLCMNWQ